MVVKYTQRKELIPELVKHIEQKREVITHERKFTQNLLAGD